MHIVIDARSRPSGMGAGRYIDRLLEHLQTIDHDNHYTILVRPTDQWQPTAPNFAALPCPFKQFSFNILDQVTFGRFLKKLQPDLVHFGMTPQEPMLYWGKRITTAHDLTMFHYVRAGGLPIVVHWARMVGYRVTFWWSLRRASKIITPTQFVADDIAKHYPFTKDKLTFTYESSEPELATQAEQPPAVNTPFIMHVGSPFPHKNIEGLIAAFEIIKQKHPKLQLVLAGKNEKYFQALQDSLSNNPIKDSVVFTGFVPDSALKWLYQNAEAYVLPSFSEGFGLVGLEAMVHGCPLVSSNATCLPEVYGQAAQYFDPHNPKDIAKAIDVVISDASLQKDLVKKGQAQLKKYSWQKMAEQTLAVYREIL
jgi:glycosyltransferase involved in cell wall biosynthesis